jgi:hypothetical protein
LCLAIPVATGADLFNTASVSYRDSAGVLRQATSNTVVITTLGPQPDPIGLPDPDLSGLEGKTFTSRDTLRLSYAEEISVFNWEFALLGNAVPFPAFASATPAFGAAHIFPVSTPAPQLNLSAVALVPGRYTVRVQAVNGSRQSGWASATITFASVDLSTVRVYPNPVRAARGHTTLTFDEMSANSTVKIFTVSGRWVKTLAAPAGAVVWDLTNDSGDRTASGVYVYLITDGQGNKSRGSFTIIK